MSTIEVNDVAKRYRVAGESPITLVADSWARVRRKKHKRQWIWPLQDISFAAARGEHVGLIGRNGAGKTTLLKVLGGITNPTRGRATVTGRVAAVLEPGVGFHAELTGRENVYQGGVVLGMTKREVRRRFDDIVEFAGVEDFLDTPLKRYSSGMWLRLAFGVAAHMEADVLLLDEVLAFGDQEFRDRCLRVIGSGEGGARTVLFVSHDLDAILEMCPRTLWLDNGALRADGPSSEVIGAYRESRFRDNRVPAELRGRDVEVTSVHIEGAASGMSPVIAVDEAFCIVLDIAVIAKSCDLCLAVLLNGMDGTTLLDVGWPPDGRRRRLERGRHRASVTLPPVLNTGDYRVAIWLGNPFDQFVFEPDAMRFRIEGRGRVNGLLRIEGDWSVDRVD